MGLDQTQLRVQIKDLWQQLAGNPANRALAIAHVARNHGSSEIQAWVRELICSQTPNSDARREALSLLLEKTEPPFPNLQLVPVEPEEEPDLIRIEPELGRLAIGLQKASYFRLWTIGRERTRSFDGSGKVSKKALWQRVRGYGISYSKQHFNYILRSGVGIFWDLSPKHVYIRSSIHVATCFIQEARRKEPELINTNLPGVRDIYLSPTGTHEQWQASLYAGFIASRSGSLTIARETLEKLFGRSQDTMRRWEQNRLHDIITVQKNLAQCAELDEYFYHIPEHAQAYVTKGKQPEVRIYWRMPNTYSVKNIRQHPRRGQASKVRKAAEQETHEPAISRRVAHSPGSVSHDCHQALFGGSGGLHTVRLYFASRKRLRAYVRKYGGVRYLYTGHNRHGHGMWEPSSDGYPDTQPRERASFKEEYWYLKAQRQKREGLG